jgi:3-dehydrosphinganine reductase
MFWIILAGVLSLPGMLVLVVTIPIVALLSLPALVLLLIRKPTKSTSMRDRRVIVSGGSSGIGKAIAIEAAKRGVSEVVILARNEVRLEAAKKEIVAVNPAVTVKSISVDVSDAPALVNVASIIFEKDTRKMTHVFCCAGEAYPEYFHKIASAVHASTTKTNQLGSIYMAQAILPHMEAGSITFTSSMAGQLGAFGYSSYSPTKFALRGFAECLHIEYSNRPIHIQVAYPPDTNTPCFEKENKTKPEETRLISETAGLAEPADIGQTMLLSALKDNPPFSVYFSFDGWLVSSLTAGFSPISTLSDAVSQVCGMSLIRWVSLLYLQYWHHVIRTYQSKTNPSTESKSD